MSQEKGKTRTRKRLGFVLYALICGFLLIEVALRVVTDDRNGDHVLFNLTQVPLPIVSESHLRILAMAPEELPYVVPDPDLGWTIRPDGKTADGLFASNGMGLRSAPTPVNVTKAPGVTRILLVGDSYTHGDEIPWPETWAAQLQSTLGESYEVLNGGVGGYGTDQALLRGRRLGARLDPDVVVLGIYRQDLLRNLTLFRAVKHPWTHYPWSKPRFVLDGEGLRLVNSPVVPPTQVESTLTDWDAFPLRMHDTLWCAPLHEDPWTYTSRIWRYLASRRIHRERYEHRQALLTGRNEGVVVTARLAKRFRDETAESKARAVVLLLPGVEGVPGYHDGGHPPLRWLHAELDRLNVPYVDVGATLYGDLKPGEKPGALFVRGVGHPNARACGIIAKTLAPHVR